MIVYSHFFLKFKNSKKTFFLYFFFLGLHLFSQETEQQEFIGMLKTPENAIITYKINFKELADGNIEGFSVTDFYGSEKTKSKINGTINRNKKTISFYETENVSTKSDANPGEFCFIHVENLKLKTKTNKTIIEGKFQGKYNTGKNCVNGYLYLVGTNFLSKSDSTLDLKPQKAIKELLYQTNNQELLPNEKLQINWISEEITFECWDSRKVDGDAISVFFDDKKILENSIINETKKAISLPFVGKEAVIKIVATNEGTQSPNTVTINLKDKTIIHPVITKLKLGETTTIILKKGTKK